MKLLKIQFLKNMNYNNEYYGLIKLNTEKYNKNTHILSNIIRKALIKDLVRFYFYKIIEELNFICKNNILHFLLFTKRKY